MVDTHSKKVRSFNMSRIKSKDTTPELIVRKFLFAKGFRYRLHDKHLPGTPDIVMKRLKTVIFINGCFWHFHDGCRYAVTPKSNEDYWLPKIEKNKIKDNLVFQQLTQMNWRIIVIWECMLKKKEVSRTLEKLADDLLL
jgi:DNA mismatch endonuclease (patch repair protein)